MNENNFIKDIGRSYIVSSFLPTALFVAVGALIFKGFFPALLVTRVIEHDEYFASQWFILAAFTGWLSFGLYSSAYSTIQFFEGYFLPERIKVFFTNRLVATFKDKKKNLVKALDIAEKKQPGSEFDMDDLIEFGDLQEKAKFEYLNVEIEIPINDKHYLPTRLGNVLRASELYPLEKYSLPHGLGWSRLMQLLPNTLKEQIEEKFNQISFVLNSALLSLGIGLLSSSLGLVRLPCQIFSAYKICAIPAQPNFFQRGYTHASPLEYLTIGIVFLLLSYFSYRMSIPIAQDFGALVRASFDLYRFDLLRKLHQPLPSDIHEEKGFWQKLTEYWVAEGRLGFETPNINYSIKKDMFDYREARNKTKKSHQEKRTRPKKIKN